MVEASEHGANFKPGAVVGRMLVRVTGPPSAHVGDEVGCAVGDRVGALLGFGVGLFARYVGDGVGFVVGDGVGLLCLYVGAHVGLIVGAGVGRLVGAEVGDNVGDAEGAGVASPQRHVVLIESYDVTVHVGSGVNASPSHVMHCGSSKFPGHVYGITTAVPLHW